MASIKRYLNKKGAVVSIQIRVYRGEDENGKTLKPYQKSVKVPKGATERQIRKLEQTESVLFEKECREGLASDSGVLFRDFAKQVLEIKRVAGKEESTLARYQDMLDERILPYFGHRKVRDINGALLNRFYQELSKPGQNKKNGGTLSAKTILEYHRLLSTIFAEAKKLRIISANPAEDATPPKTPRKTPNYFQPEDLALIQQAFDEAPIKWRTLGYLFMNYGDRRSEFAGIKRQNIDFKRHQILLSGSVLYHPRKDTYEKSYPKNEKARYLPMTPTIEVMLKEYLAWLDAEKEKWGDRWIESDYVFTAERGGPMNPDTITKYFARLYKQWQRKNPAFPHMNPHAFRHTVASLLLNSGVDLISVADFVGDDPATVAKFYAHLVNAGKTRASNTMAAILGFTEQNDTQNAS